MHAQPYLEISKFQNCQEDKSTDDNANDLEFSQMLWAPPPRLLRRGVVSPITLVSLTVHVISLPKGERWIIYFPSKATYLSSPLTTAKWYFVCIR